MRGQAYIPNILYQLRTSFLLFSFLIYLAAFSSPLYSACGDGPAIFTLIGSATYSGNNAIQTRVFIQFNSTCAENITGDGFEDGVDYIIIPANTVLTLDINSVFSFADQPPFNPFPRPVRILIEGANNDAINGQIKFNKATGSNTPGYMLFRDDGSNILFVDNATNQNMIAPAPEDCLNAPSNANSEVAIIIDKIPDPDIIYMFNDLGDITNRGALPIELAFFEALSDERGVVLRWRTLWEVDNDFFEVQRSKDGETFIRLEKVKGLGNSDQGNLYQYIDAHPNPAVNYYRLKQVDFDGAHAYSNVITVNMGKGQKDIDFIVTPNPVNHTFQVLTSKALLNKPRLFLSNALGQFFSVQFSEVGNGYEVQLPAQLSAGNYQLHVVMDRKVIYKTIVVQ